MRPVTRSSKALLERPQEGVGAFGIAGWRVRKLRPGGLFQTNSADEFWEIQSPTTCHRWFCRQIIGTEAWWQGAQGGHRPFTSLYHLYPSTLINPNSLPLKHVETSRSYAAMLAMLSVLLCALLCVSYVFLCLASWSLSNCFSLKSLWKGSKSRLVTPDTENKRGVLADSNLEWFDSNRLIQSFDMDIKRASNAFNAWTLGLFG